MNKSNVFSPERIQEIMQAANRLSHDDGRPLDHVYDLLTPEEKCEIYKECKIAWIDAFLRMTTGN